MNLGYEFSGVGDPTRESDAEWTAESLVGRLKPLFANDVVIYTEGHPLAFGLQRPADEVTLHPIFRFSDLFE